MAVDLLDFVMRCLVAALAEVVLSRFLWCFRETCGDLDILLQYEVGTSARTALLDWGKTTGRKRIVEPVTK